MSRLRVPSPVPAPTLLLGIVVTLVLLQLLIVSKGEAPWPTWLLAPLYGAYVTAVLLLCAALVLRARGRPPLPLPLFPARWSTHPRAYLGLGVAVVLVTLLREGAFAPTLLLSYDVYQAEHRTNTSHHHGGNSATLGHGPPDVMAGRPVRCSLHCATPAPTCEAVLEEIRCDGDRDPSLPVEGSVLVTGTIRMEDPSCYVPLYKSTHTEVGAELSLGLQTERTTTQVGLSFQGTLEQDSTGPMSCLAHRRLAAKQVAVMVAGALQATLDAN